MCDSDVFLLQSQESKYNAKVEAVQAEHNKLLEEAFVRAKVSCTPSAR